MTTGEMLYLLLTTAMMVIFSAVLAYYSWQQAKAGPDIVSRPDIAPAREPAHVVTA